MSSSDRLFLALQSGVSARRLADGAEVWQTPLEVDGPMAASDERLVVAAKGELQVLDASTGAVAWTDARGAVDGAAARARRVAVCRVRANT